MAGVGMRVVRWQRVPVGIGKKTLEGVLGQMRLDSRKVGKEEETSGEKVKALGEKIVKEEIEAAAVAAAAAAATAEGVEVEQSIVPPN